MSVLTFNSLEEECNYLYKQSVRLLDLIEVAGVEGRSFETLKFKVLNLANDIKRLPSKYKEGD